ncbi:Imm53 family immunity protein [Actinoplanes sp. ATCC 53533]|uniref:Imm53 family immunity protein n=1 Tax=Actinoplanes sp. ATCC 53533 TaxID=1288362 RepID=UPI0018F73F90|nr:Imm53 family immunity protein [Actinoplanes sp. ATCC 53533]
MVLPDRVADDYFDYLANWYAAQCDDDWEHEFGIRLQTLDNPGWNLQIDLVGTELEGQVLGMTRRDLEGGGWIVVAADGALFEVSCDPMSLRLAIHEFKQLVESD